MCVCVCVCVCVCASRALASCRAADRAMLRMHTPCVRGALYTAGRGSHQPLWRKKAQIPHGHWLLAHVAIHQPRTFRACARRGVPRRTVFVIPPPLLPPHFRAGEVEPVAALHVLDFLAALVPAPVYVPRAVRVGGRAAGRPATEHQRSRHQARGARPCRRRACRGRQRADQHGHQRCAPACALHCSRRTHTRTQKVRVFEFSKFKNSEGGAYCKRQWTVRR
jgi:hypothetical protein